MIKNRLNYVMLFIGMAVLGIGGCAKQEAVQETSGSASTRIEQTSVSLGVDRMSENVTVEKRAVTKVTRGDLVMDVSWPKVVVLGEPIVVDMTLTNNWTKRVRLDPMVYSSEVDIQVFGSKQQPIDRTIHGLRVLKPEGRIIASGGFVPLEPGNSYSWQKDLNKCFKLRPGKYAAYLAIDVVIEDIPSNTVTTFRIDDCAFEIVAP